MVSKRSVKHPCAHIDEALARAERFTANQV